MTSVGAGAGAGAGADLRLASIQADTDKLRAEIAAIRGRAVRVCGRVSLAACTACGADAPAGAHADAHTDVHAHAAETRAQADNWKPPTPVVVVSQPLATDATPTHDAIPTIVSLVTLPAPSLDAA